MDDADVLATWLVELTQPEPNPAIIASMETIAEDQGWSPRRALRALLARTDFNPDMHPRGHDGKFIEKFGLVKLLGKVTAPDGRKVDATGRRGIVEGIDPDPRSPGRPNIRVRMLDKDGRPGPPVHVKPDGVEQAQEKARLDRPLDRKPGRLQPAVRVGKQRPNVPNMSQRADQRAGTTNWDSPAKPPQYHIRFDPNSDHVAQFTGGNPLGENGTDDYGRSAAKSLSDSELDQVIAMRQQDVTDRKGLSPTQDLKVLQAEKTSRSAYANSPEAYAEPPTPPHARVAGPKDKPFQYRETRTAYGLDTKYTTPWKDPATLDDDELKTARFSDKELRDASLGRYPSNTGGSSIDRDMRAYNEQIYVESQRRESAAIAKEARTVPDAELDYQTTVGPSQWRAAVEAEKQDRLARRAAEEKRRQDLIDDINEQAKGLSTTDAEERAVGLDAILAKLRFSIIDTDKVHDQLYPPENGSRWTPERTAQHEAMWDQLLANVEAAGIPKNHDAFVLGGLPGAGKSYSLRPGEKAEGFGVRAWETNMPVPQGGATHVSINPDVVKEMLIANGMLPEGLSDDLKPMEKVTFLHEESSYLAKVFSARLGEEGYNIVLDNTFDSEGGMLKRMTPLAREGYTFRGLFADIPVDESKASAKKRYIDAALTPEGGRFVPSSVQGNRGTTSGNMSKNRDAFDNMVKQDWFTDYMVIDNTGVIDRNPKGDVVMEGTGEGSAAGAYLPGAEKNPPKAGPKLPTPPEAPPTIEVGPTAPAA